MAVSEPLSFHYGEIPYFRIIIDEYIKNSPHYSLYSYVTDLVDSWYRCGNVPYPYRILNSEGENINVLHGIDNIYYRIVLVNLYHRDSPKWHLGKSVEKYEKNTEFKKMV